MTMPNTAWEQQCFDLGEYLVGSTSMATHQYACVKIHTDGTIRLAASGEASIGIMKDNNAVGQPCSICVLGVFPALAGTNISSGVANPMVALTCDSDSGVKAASTGDVVVGYSLEPMAAGEVHPILVLPRMQAGTLPTGARGGVPYYGGSGWASLAAGTNGMQFNMGATDPAWGNTAAYTTLSISMDLADIPVGGADLMTAITPGFAGTIEKFYAVNNKVGTGTLASFAIHPTIGATPTTGGVLTITVSNMGTLGAVVASTTISGAKTFTNSDTISIVAAAGTVFTAGKVTFVIVLKPTTVVI